MVIFNSYVCLPEGIYIYKLNMWNCQKFITTFHLTIRLVNAFIDVYKYHPCYTSSTFLHYIPNESPVVSKILR